MSCRRGDFRDSQRPRVTSFESSREAQPPTKTGAWVEAILYKIKDKLPSYKNWGGKLERWLSG